MTCEDQRTIHTIGHSTRTIKDFIGLLNSHRIESLIDVRRWPMSKRHPHFNREALAASLDDNGIAYTLREDLGGFRKVDPDSPNSAWRVATFRAYADFMLSADFARIIAEVESSASVKRMTLMCAEAVPWRCHRQLLADALLVRGWSVRHIMDDGCHAHKLPAFARLEGMRIIYNEMH
ncbi:MAG TPA: DUF488 domain-containing protein [Pyrinomonadaceae bacterium]